MAAVCEIGYPTVHAVDDDGAAHVHLVGYCTSYGTFEGVFTIGAVEGPRRSVERVGRLIGDNVERPSDGVVAEEGALRPLQYFDMVQIEERVGSRTRAPVIDVVDEGRHRLVEGAVFTRPDTSNIHIGVAAAGRHRYRGQGLRESLQRKGILLDEGLSADHLGRNRHVLKVLRAALSGDDYLFELVRWRGG